MDNFNFKLTIICSLLIFTTVAFWAADVKANADKRAQTDIVLPTPQTSGSMPLMDALKNRKTERSFSKIPLSQVTVSNLLWAANGINRPDSGGHTAPSAFNSKEISLYAILPSGAYLYNEKDNVLKLVNPSKEELKVYQEKAPMVVVFVADLAKQSKEYAYVDSGFIGQNIYLFCAANNLNSVFKGGIDAADLAKKLKIDDGKIVLFAQFVGYPPKTK